MKWSKSVRQQKLHLHIEMLVERDNLANEYLLFKLFTQLPWFSFSSSTWRNSWGQIIVVISKAIKWFADWWNLYFCVKNRIYQINNSKKIQTKAPKSCIITLLIKKEDQECLCEMTQWNWIAFPMFPSSLEKNMNSTCIFLLR